MDADVNEMSRLTEALSEMHRSALPNVVRNSLNDLAFETKKMIPVSADENFENRTKTFFKANSRVKKAEGFNLSNMESEAGIIAKDKATKNLEFQEKGGTVQKRAFIPLDGARTSKSFKKKVARGNRLSSVEFVNSSNMRGGRKQRLIKAVIAGQKQKKDVLHEGTVFRVGDFRETDEGLRFRLSHMYSYEKGRTSNVKATRFAEEAALMVTPSLGKIYKKNFDRQIEKLKQKNRL